MGYGLLQQGQTTKGQAMQGIQNAAKMEQERNNANRSLKYADKQAKTQMASTGATMGAMYGLSNGALGLTGMSAGLATGGIGLAAGLLLSELF